MKNSIIFLLLLSGMLSRSYRVHAQKAEEALNSLLKNHVIEKVYIQYDKDFYVAGETIWFKAYLYSDGLPSSLSHNFYLQLSDRNGRIIADQKYPVNGAAVTGNIDLPDSLEQGTYYVRAVTPAMLNDNSDFLYNKPLYIFNPDSKKEIPVADPAAQPSIRFFPESGDLVENVLSVVAFSATNGNGRPLDISGSIKMDDTVTVVSFKSLHDGIGSFPFRPLPGKKYSAEIISNNNKLNYPLPAIQSSGINLRVENEKGGKVFTLSRSKKEKELYATVRLLAQLNNRVVFDNEIAFDKYYLVKGHLLTDSMPSGILHFTVFSNEGLPLAERISFVDNHEYESKGEIKWIKQGAGKREENILDINFADSAQRSFSVSVTDPSVSALKDRDDIVSAFLLTGDLHGEINNPAWYFHKGDDTLVQKALDNLLLTHGWSRFSWKKILAGEFPQKKCTDSYLFSISGTVYNESGTGTIADGKLDVLFLLEDSSMLSYSVPVNQKGAFVIDSLLMRGNCKGYYTYKDIKGKEKPVTIKTAENWLSPGLLNTGKLLAGDISVSNREELKKVVIRGKQVLIDTKFSGSGMLENVTIKTKPRRPTDIVNEKYTSAIFRDKGRIIADNITFPPNDRAMNGLDFVKNRITTVEVQRGTFINKKNFSLENHKDSKGAHDAEMRFWEVGLFLNEMPVDIQQLKALRADQIALVKFYEAGFMGAGGVYPGGAIAVYLNEKPELKIPDKATTRVTEINHKGYTLTKEFYSPEYATVAPNSPSADLRTTLYWNPELYTSSQGNTVQLKFYNNDLSRRFKIVIEGFESNGRLIHLEKMIGD